MTSGDKESKGRQQGTRWQCTIWVSNHTNPGIPRSQDNKELDFEDCSGAGSVPMVQGVATTDSQG
eukprot:10750637-Prorocentrum_lima.AAC.1